jgi:hypothetical protein
MVFNSEFVKARHGHADEPLGASPVRYVPRNFFFIFFGLFFLLF